MYLLKSLCFCPSGLRSGLLVYYTSFIILPNRCRPLRGWKTRPEKERQGRPTRHHSIPAPRERGLIQQIFGLLVHHTTDNKTANLSCYRHFCCQFIVQQTDSLLIHYTTLRNTFNLSYNRHSDCQFIIQHTERLSIYHTTYI